MQPVPSYTRHLHAVVDVAPMNPHSGSVAPASVPGDCLSATVNMTVMVPWWPRGGEPDAAGLRGSDAIHDRMAAADIARVQHWRWIHPATEMPRMGRSVSVDPVPEVLADEHPARHAAQRGEVYVRGRGSVVGVGVDALVRDRDRAGFPTTTAYGMV